MDSIEAPRIRINNYCLLSTLKPMVTRFMINCRHMHVCVHCFGSAKCWMWGGTGIEGKHSMSHQHSGGVDPSSGAEPFDYSHM